MGRDGRKTGWKEEGSEAAKLAGRAYAFHTYTTIGHVYVKLQLVCVLKMLKGVALLFL